MRITFAMQAMRYDNSLSGSLARVMEAEERMYAKRNLLRPEQNPSSYVGAYSVQRMIQEIKQFSANASNANGWTTEASNQLEAIMKQIAKAKNDLAIGGANTTNDADSRLALAGEVAAIYSALMAGANSSFMGKYIFGGFQTDRPPFTQDSNEVTNVVSKENGVKAESKPIYSDLPELASGDYVATITVENGVGKLTIKDKYGKPITLDTNGSDQSGKAGNNTSTELTFEFKPGETINTGRGVSITIPKGNTSGMELSFNYKSGSEVAYNGDLNSILASIGYNQDLAINMPGSSIFTQSFKTLLSSKLNTVNGLPVGLGSLFSRLDKTTISYGDSIKASGTDHSGRPIGSANILAPGNVKLDQTKTSEEERTLNVTYGNSVYKIVIPQASYKTSEDLSKAINGQLQFAEYVGSIDNPANGYKNVQEYQTSVNQQIAAGKFPPASNAADAGKYTVDLRSQVSVTTDGDRLQFYTTKTGDNVRLAVTGGELNSLGFQNKTLASIGKDTEFELGATYSANGRIDNISNTHSGIDFTTPGIKTFVVNGKRISINVPAAVAGTPVTFGAADLSGANDYTFTLQGKDITVKSGALATATTAAERAAIINQAVADAGLGGQFSATVADPAGAATITFAQQTSPLKKDIELMLNNALNAAGLNFTVNASLQARQPQPPATVGEFDVTFASVNTNINKETQITSTYYDDLAVPPTSDMQTDKPLNMVGARNDDKSFGDYINFLQDLYGDSATVSLVKGKIEVKDNRSGESKLTFYQNPTNTGVGIPSGNTAIVSGNYTGVSDNLWNVSVTTNLGPNGERNLSVEIRGLQNQVLFSEKYNNYKGGEISLPSGIKFTPDDMGLPNAAGDTTATSNFTLKLTANTSLNMGDSKVTEDGSNVNIFRALTNLEHALKYNITKFGFGEPTAWKNSTAGAAKPFLDGTYKGSYNDNWKYEVLQAGGKTDYYLQNEYKTSTGAIKFDAALMARTSTLDFGVNIYDNVTGKSSTVPINIDLSKAFPPLTDAKSTQNYIISELNKDTRFRDEGITFSNVNGKIEMSSNNGTKIASIAQNSITGPAGELTTEFTNFILGFEPLANKKVEFPITLGAPEDIQVSDLFDPAALPGDAVMKNITIPAGTYTTEADLLLAVNAELTAVTGGRVSASLDSNGALQFKTADGSTVTSTATDPASALGILSSTNASSKAPTALQAAKTDLSEADDTARSLTFKYVDDLGRDQTTSIILDKKAYSTQQDLADEINSKLAAAGVINNEVTARVDVNGMLAFTTETTGRVNSLAVEGDYAGTLGFPRAGDEVKILVTSENGGTIQEVKMNVANKTQYIADGLYLGFDKGSLKASDSFNAAIGSGIDNEITSLEKAEKQVLRATTIFGNRGARIESVLAFQKTLITSNEAVRAGYLGSTEMDLAKAVTDWKLATSAYESALSITGKMMSMSLLDFLR